MVKLDTLNRMGRMRFGVLDQLGRNNPPAKNGSCLCRYTYGTTGGKLLPSRSSYFVSSVGGAPIETLKQYIRAQEKPC